MLRLAMESSAETSLLLSDVGRSEIRRYLFSLGIQPRESEFTYAVSDRPEGFASYRLTGDAHLKVSDPARRVPRIAFGQLARYLAFVVAQKWRIVPRSPAPGA